MAATYSSFMTTRFYSPVFNTALFDGPMRIYFSQSYESAALKIYHLLQTEYSAQWNLLKASSLKSKEHVFLMMYPDKIGLELVFPDQVSSAAVQEWDEGLAIGFCQPQDDAELAQQLEIITQSIASWIEKSKTYEVSI